jgi:hypothetical protein
MRVSFLSCSVDVSENEVPKAIFEKLLWCAILALTRYERNLQLSGSGFAFIQI